MDIAEASQRADSPAQQISAPVRWNLADLYPSTDHWKAEAAALERDIAGFADRKGHLSESAAALSDALDAHAALVRRFLRLATYAWELFAEDTGSAPSLELRQRTDLVGSRLDQATAFMDPEILAIGRERIDGMLRDEPRLAIHRHPIDRVLRAAPHTLDDDGEALVAAFGEMTDAGRDAYSILSNADMPWPTVRLSTGEEARIDFAGYTRHRESQVRDDRRQVMDAFFATYRSFERTIGVSLYSQLKQDAVYARVRRYPDSIARALDRNRIPVAVLDTLIEQANDNLPTLHRYFGLRARMLGVDTLHYYDLYPPLVTGDFRFPYERARDLVLGAVGPLGDRYVEAMRQGLDGGWMDLYPRPRKQSGAHSNGNAYDVHPYVLMNYNDDYSSVTTLAHEWGHAMHSWLANRAQPFVTAGYATFVAEIASTFNEELLLQRMLALATSDDERLFYLGSALETMRGTFFRQTMLAEFERAVHRSVDAGDPMSAASFTRTYAEILRRYHGSDEGVVAIDDAYCVEWAYIPHFYTSFYVYQYATSLAAAAEFARAVIGGEAGAIERYLGLLEAGGSDYPYDLVRAAGVDLAAPAPYRSLIARMNAMMDEIEAILARRKSY